MQHLVLRDPQVESEREVVMNERRQRVDNQPYGRAYEQLYELLFAEPHPYRWPVIGYMQDIAAATLEDIESFFRTYYAPNNAVLTLAGDFEPAEAYVAVERFFGGIDRGPAISRTEVTPQPITSERRMVQEDRVELSRVYIGYHSPPVSSKEWLAADLLASVLTGGKSSPLYQDLAHDRQLVQDVSAFVMPTEIAGNFFLVATARPGVEVEMVEAALTEHLEAAASELPAETELERARNHFLTAYFERLQSLDDRADLLSRFTTLHDDPWRIETEVDRYLGLTASDLRDFAERHLAATRRAVLHVVPMGAA